MVGCECVWFVLCAVFFYVCSVGVCVVGGLRVECVKSVGMCI